ncbi:glycoside hydrolase family 88 protein [Glaciecola sp. SC05]|uniref:glycoside hydrolase family 88 protein n=1 Tax=Glaciecola sp. SC05 TaxID=1987355 RepID=UPI003526E80D
MVSSKYSIVLLSIAIGGCAVDRSEPADSSASQIMGFNPYQQSAAFCSAALDAASTQLNDFRNMYKDPSQIPRSFNEGENDNKARLVPAKDWTSGFVAGSFWYVYEHTQDASWRETAQQWTYALEEQQFHKRTHDVGFIMNNSYGNGLRLTGNESYKPILVQTADTLMERFHPTVGATLSWNFGTWEFPVIIDNMMNLELLFEATKFTGDAKYSEAAISHATVTMNNHFRPDYSSYHVVDYSKTTGEAILKETHQGINDQSDWARGQAWGAYGYTMMYRYTKDKKFLEQAKNIANFYLSHPNLPADSVPYFDFDAPDFEDVPNYRDSSAASLMASNLLELAEYVEKADADRYRKAALDMLVSLSTPAYLAAKGENGSFLLKQATGNYPRNDELSGALNYADYYYLEALLRCKKTL